MNRSAIYGYDGAGNLITVQNPRDSATSFTLGYDVANELTSITYNDGTTPKVVYQYDALGRRQQMTDGTGVTTYVFDSLHRLVQSTNGAGSQVRYGYDLLGHLTQLVYPGVGQVVTRTYDDAGRTASITDWLGNTTRFSYDTNGNLTSEAYPNRVTANYNYDAADHLTQASDTFGASQLLTLSYARDARSQLTSENSTTYSYDAINRVVGTTAAAATTTYSYDSADNVTSVATGSISTTLTYDGGHELQTATTKNGSTQTQKFTYTYNADGNRTSRTDQNNTTIVYGWDQADRLTSSGATSSYAYNGDGLRMSKTVSGLAEAFTWDIADGLPVILRDGQTSYVTGPDGLPLEQITAANSVYFFHQDQSGSTRLVTDGSASAVATYSYDVFGNVTSTGTLNNPFQFAGQYTDAESGLQYLRARYYDPAVEQFIARDPALALTEQPYAYAGDSGPNGSDPTGLYDCGLAFWNCLHPENLLHPDTWGLPDER